MIAALLRDSSLHLLDRLRPDLEAVVKGDKSARSRARDEYGELSKLVKAAGGRNLVERWGDEELNSMNVRIWNAYTSYGAVLMYPNNADLRHEMGTLYIRRGQPQNAYQLYDHFDWEGASVADFAGGVAAAAASAQAGLSRHSSRLGCHD